MTLRSCEKICSLVITKHEDDLYCGKGEDGEFWVHSRDDKDAAFRICELHWKDVSMKVMHRQDFRCLLCGKISPLSIDHIKLRSHGRRDRPSDLQALCTPCHQRKHGVRVA